MARERIMGKIRIVLADVQEIPRTAVGSLLDRQPDMEVIGQSGDSRETLDLTARLAPAILILDLDLPGIGGMKVIDKIRQEHPATRILVLTMHDDTSYFNAARALGCTGFVSKTRRFNDLLEAIRTVHEGREYVALHTAMNGHAFPPRTPGEQLTARERQVLQLLAQGYRYQRIAEDLFLSVKTIETYRTRIGQKLGFHSRADLVRYALETGLMGPCQSP